MYVNSILASPTQKFLPYILSGYTNFRLLAVSGRRDPSGVLVTYLVANLTLREPNHVTKLSNILVVS